MLRKQAAAQSLMKMAMEKESALFTTAALLAMGIPAAMYGISSFFGKNPEEIEAAKVKNQLQYRQMRNQRDSYYRNLLMSKPQKDLARARGYQMMSAAQGPTPQQQQSNDQMKNWANQWGQGYQQKLQAAKGRTGLYSPLKQVNINQPGWQAFDPTGTAASSVTAQRPGATANAGVQNFMNKKRPYGFTMG